VRNKPLELRLVHDWLDSWSGIGLIVVGMTYQGWTYSSRLTRHATGARTSPPVGIAHSIIGGSAWKPTPWWAVQWAASAALLGRP
jgi:hypothetical protein